MPARRYMGSDDIGFKREYPVSFRLYPIIVVPLIIDLFYRYLTSYGSDGRIAPITLPLT